MLDATTITCGDENLYTPPRQFFTTANIHDDIMTKQKIKSIQKSLEIVKG